MDIWIKFTCIIADAFCVRLEVILGKTAPLKVHFLTTTDQIFCGEDSSGDWGSGVWSGYSTNQEVAGSIPASPTGSDNALQILWIWVCEWVSIEITWSTLDRSCSWWAGRHFAGNPLPSVYECVSWQNSKGRLFSCYLYKNITNLDASFIVVIVLSLSMH